MQDFNRLDDNGSQNNLTLLPVCKYFQTFNGNIDKTFEWKPKGFSEETITTPATLNNSFAPKLAYVYNSKTVVRFEVNCLK